MRKTKLGRRSKIRELPKVAGFLGSQALALLAMCTAATVFTTAAEAGFEVEPGSFKVEAKDYSAGANSNVRFEVKLPVYRSDGTMNYQLQSTVAHLPPGMIANLANPRTVCGEPTMDYNKCFDQNPLSKIATIEGEIMGGGAFDNPGHILQWNNKKKKYREWDRKWLKGPAESAAIYNLGVDRIGRAKVARLGIFIMTQLDSPPMSSAGRYSANGYAVLRAPGDNGVDVFVDSRLMNFTTRIDITMFGRANDNIDAETGEEADPPNPVLLRNPSTCQAQTFGFDLEGWQGDDVDTVSVSAPYQSTNCSSSNPFLNFSPELAVSPFLTLTDHPSPYDVTIKFPPSVKDPKFDPAKHKDEEIPRLDQAPPKRIEVKLPEGVTLSPPSAEGEHAIASCRQTREEFKSAANDCPPSSQVGTVAIKSPLLPSGRDDGGVKDRAQGDYVSLAGKVYLGPIDTATNNYPLYVAIDDYGFKIRTVGDTFADPITARLRSVFDDLPPHPMSEMRLHFKDRKDPDRSVMSNPSKCGDYRAEGSMSSWGLPDAPVATQSPAFAFSPCLTAFNPDITVNQSSTKGGAATTSELRVKRGPLQQHIRKLHVSLPAGVTAKLAGVPICSEASADAGACKEESRVGTVETAVGTGSKPVTLSGGAYLTGRKGTDPAGLAIVVPAKVGDIDLGSVVIRARVEVRDDLGLNIIAELPRTVHGIPVVIRWMGMNVDRDGFMYNPTNCDIKWVTGKFSSDLTDSTTQVMAQPTECDRLPFDPGLEINVDAGKKRGPHLPVSVSLTPRGLGNASVRSAEVTLPKSLAADYKAADRGCPIDKLKAGSCSQASRIGTARALSPLLPEELAGPIYLVDLPDAALPGIAVRLEGQVQVGLNGTISISSDGMLKTTFNNLPDVPVDRFEMAFDGGKDGALIAGKGLCDSKPGSANGVFAGHNGATRTLTANIKVRNCRIAAKRKSCKRKIKVKLPKRLHGRRAHFKRATVYIGGKRVKRYKRGLRRSLPVTIKGRAGRRYKVKVIAITRGGKRVVIKRKLRACAKRKSKR